MSTERRVAKPWLSRLGKPDLNRRHRLYACGWRGRAWDLLTHPDSRAAVEVAERVADGRAAAEEFGAAGRAAWAVVKAGRKVGTKVGAAEQCAAEAAAWAAARHPTEASREAGRFAYKALVKGQKLKGKSDYDSITRAIRPWWDEVFPFEKRPTLPVIDAGWLTWNAGTVQQLAAGIDDERAYDRMPVLADALEDAGCADREILHHCRSKRSHACGCWVIDLLLGRLGPAAPDPAA